MRISVKGNTSHWTTASLREALRVGMLWPNNPYAERVKALSVKFVKTKFGDARLVELRRTEGLNWFAKISMSGGTADNEQLARVLRLLGQMTGRATPTNYDMPHDQSKPTPTWSGFIDLVRQDAVDVVKKRADARVARIAYCRLKAAQWAKVEAQAKTHRLKWEKALKAQERGAVLADRAFLKSGKIGLTREDLAGADAAFEVHDG